MNEPTQGQIGDVLTEIVRTADDKLLALEEAELAAQWHWRWEEGRSNEWNTYTFADMLDLYKRRCRRWEEHHGGICGVVERVRDKYLMQRVREFLAALATHNAEHEPRAVASRAQCSCSHMSGLKRHTADLCDRCGHSHAPNMPCENRAIHLSNGQ
jgi:hypothetical protein